MWQLHQLQLLRQSSVGIVTAYSFVRLKYREDVQGGYSHQ